MWLYVQAVFVYVTSIMIFWRHWWQYMLFTAIHDNNIIAETASETIYVQQIAPDNCTEVQTCHMRLPMLALRKDL